MEELNSEDSSKRFGEILVNFGVITEPQNKQILAFQKNNPEMMYGEIAVFFGYITKDKLEKYIYLEEVERNYPNQNEDYSKIENRLERRHQIFFDLTIQHGNEEYKATSLDISRGGLQLLCTKQFPNASVLSIYPVKMKLQKPLQYTVLWIKPNEDSDLIRYGGQFSEKLSEIDFYAIMRICKS